MKKNRIALLTVILFICCFYVSPAQAVKEIKIGMIGPISGPSAYSGSNMKKAAEMAVAEINDKGGIQGKKIVLIVEDDESVPVKAVNSAQKLVTKDKVVSVVGHLNSSCTLASMAVTQKNSVPHLCPISTAESITSSGHKYIFRNCATNPMQVGQLADYVFTHLKKEGRVNKVAIFYEHTDYGKGIFDVFRDKVKANASDGWELAAVEIYKPGDNDMIPQLTNIKDVEPDFILFGGNVTEVAQAVRQCKDIGLKAQFLALGGVSNDKFPELAGKDNVEGMINVSYFETSSKNPEARKFIENFQEKYNEDPDMISAAVYEAFYILEYALNKTDLNQKKIKILRKALRDNVADIKNLPGVQGMTSYDESGQADKKVYIVKWKDGKRVIIYPEGSE